ncbi:hypothetical protein DKX38_005179 [Salix brachista]|uniref:Uncharacterized protein n=1 Tax=Salix brachista TaxID=2182728 RepID=A0A5N5NBY3_9ROSI|nr:hypothetical protein DKX38_005179 [Salix brachista]
MVHHKGKTEFSRLLLATRNFIKGLNTDFSNPREQHSRSLCPYKDRGNGSFDLRNSRRRWNALEMAKSQLAYVKKGIHEIRGTKLLVVTFLIMRRESRNKHGVMMQWCLMGSLFAVKSFIQIHSFMGFITAW